MADEGISSEANPLLEELARGREHAYHLFRQVFLRGLNAGLYPFLQSIPELAQALPAGELFNPDEAAADHYHLFGFNVYPYESAFLEVDGHLGGAVTDQVQTFYREVGLAWRQSGESADHVGHELGLLAFLSGAEADAWADGLSAVASRIRTLQGRFLDHHLLRWLPGLNLAIASQGHAFYSALAGMTLELVLEHRAALATAVSSERQAFTLPNHTFQLADLRTGMKDIAAYLVTPAKCGFFISRDEIGRLAGRYNLPRGFGDRQSLLTNLLRSAADYGMLPQVLDELVGIVTSWENGYRRLDGSTGTLDHLAGIAPAWLMRLGSTRELIGSILYASSTQSRL